LEYELPSQFTGVAMAAHPSARAEGRKLSQAVRFVFLLLLLLLRLLLLLLLLLLLQRLRLLLWLLLHLHLLSLLAAAACCCCCHNLRRKTPGRAKPLQMNIK